MRSTAALFVVVLPFASVEATRVQDRPAGEFEGAIEVVERAVWFDPSTMPQIQSIGERADGDFLVLEDGAARELVERRVITEDEPLRHLLWLDPELAGSATLARAARRMAEALPELQQTGPLAVVLAGVDGVAPEGVAGSAGQARLIAIAREIERRPPAPLPPIERRLRALDRLNVELVELRSGATGAVWLAVDGWTLALAELAELERAESPEPETRLDDPATVLRRTARIAAAYGWTLFPFAARAEVDPTQLRRETRDPARERFVPEDPLRPTFYLFRWRYPKRKRVPPRAAAMALELATDLRLQPFEKLAGPTAGAVVGDAFAVVHRAQRLAGRRSLVVREPEVAPGTLQRLEVLWLGDGRRLRTPGWVRSGVPAEVAAARLAALDTGGLDQRRGWPVSIDRGADPARICLEEVRPSGWLRLSVRSRDGAVRLGAPFELAEGASPCAPLPPRAAPDDWLLLEEVDGSAWGALRLP